MAVQPGEPVLLEVSSDKLEVTAHCDTIITIQREARNVNDTVKDPIEFTVHNGRVTISAASES
jgi:hypothetical protein